MTGIRRALLWSTADKYFSLVVNFASLAVISRLLTPEEIGVSAVGTAIIAFALALREFASTGFLIQHKNLTRRDIRTSFTILFALTFIIAAALVAFSPWMAAFFGEPDLSRFVGVLSIAIVIETIGLPITALLRREMAFGRLAAINISVAAVCAPLSIVLAAIGFSFMSTAWAWLAATTMTTVLSLCIRPDFWIFRPSLRAWRSVLAFGAFGGANTVLIWLNETLPQLVLGRILPLGVVGLYNRALLICSIPDKVVLNGVSSVATPALAAEVRHGRCIKQVYLQSLGFITVVHWPALIVLLLLAEPVVEIVLGSQWLAIVPVVQLLAIASLFRFPSILTSSVLIAVGAVNLTLQASLISLPISALVLCLASPFGVVAMAATQLFTVPFQTLVAIHFIRRHVPFGWRELIAALRQSAFVTACSSGGPAVVITLGGFRFDLSFSEALTAVLISAAGWLVGIWLAQHPALAELQRILRLAVENAIGQRLINGILRRPGRRGIVNAADLNP
jgi:O-antigen/teichoic acid export membrane protein